MILSFKWSHSKIRDFDGASLRLLVCQDWLSPTDNSFHAVLKPQRLLNHSELCETKEAMNLIEGFHQHALGCILKYLEALSWYQKCLRRKQMGQDFGKVRETLEIQRTLVLLGINITSNSFIPELPSSLLSNIAKNKVMYFWGHLLPASSEVRWSQTWLLRTQSQCTIVTSRQNDKTTPEVE